MEEKQEYFTFTKSFILDSEKRFRTKLINSLAGIRQVALVGTKSSARVENLAIFNSVIHLGAHLGLISRPDTVSRDTLENMMENGKYTLNFIDRKWVKDAHQTSARYAKEVSEFSATDFSSEYSGDCSAPFVKEAEIKIEMKLQQILDIEINNTKLLIGSVEWIQVPAERFTEDCLVKHHNLLLSGGLDAYYSAEMITQLEYAKP